MSGHVPTMGHALPLPAGLEWCDRCQAMTAGVHPHTPEAQRERLIEHARRMETNWLEEIAMANELEVRAETSEAVLFVLAFEHFLDKFKAFDVPPEEWDLMGRQWPPCERGTCVFCEAVR